MTRRYCDHGIKNYEFESSRIYFYRINFMAKNVINGCCECHESFQINKIKVLRLKVWSVDKLYKNIIHVNKVNTVFFFHNIPETQSAYLLNYERKQMSHAQRYANVWNNINSYNDISHAFF